MSSAKFVAQKILNIKEQDGTKMVLVQWQNYSVQHATWESLNKFEDIESLIQQYEKSKVNDKNKNFALKLSQKIDIGENPYEQTQRHGHFMYGDQPQCIESTKVFKNPQSSQQPVTVICEIKWKDRVEYDYEGKPVYVILQNSFIDTETISEFKPDFLAKFYEKRIMLSYQPDQTSEID